MPRNHSPVPANAGPDKARPQYNGTISAISSRAAHTQVPSGTAEQNEISTFFEIIKNDGPEKGLKTPGNKLSNESRFEYSLQAARCKQVSACAPQAEACTLNEEDFLRDYHV